MGCDPNDAPVGHDMPGVVALICTKGFLMSATERKAHLQLAQRLEEGLDRPLTDGREQLGITALVAR